eukprot:TRINITY_DN29478_c0_g2_i1.p1 TRINITY_DN29478_c0_g2~~TRINITY_DN29478_c0_g2_i1.p1  ORF type:complete len:337 (-),score=62.26 TRINITY_DN29478_c0_g2_i1:163-1173(-)
MSDIDVISLNVGGVRMQTFRSTLTKYPRSLLAMKFNSLAAAARITPMTDDGYFLDRDPDTFRQVLNFLRRGVLSPNLTTDQLEELRLEAKHFNLQELRTKVDAALTGGDQFINFVVAGVNTKVDMALFGDIPKYEFPCLFQCTVGKDFFSDRNETIIFHNAEAFSLITNSLRQGYDVTEDVTSGDEVRDYDCISYGARLLLFMKNSFYSKRSHVKVELRSAAETLEKDVDRKLLLKDPKSLVSQSLTNKMALPMYDQLNKSGCLVLGSNNYSLDKIEALLTQLKHTGVLKGHHGAAVDKMSLVAREVGLLAQDMILSATQFKQEKTLAHSAKRRRN